MSAGYAIISGEWKGLNPIPTLHLPTSPYIPLHLATSRYISLHLPTSRYISLHLAASRYISLHLAASRCISQVGGLLEVSLLRQQPRWKELVESLRSQVGRMQPRPLSLTLSLASAQTMTKVP